MTAEVARTRTSLTAEQTATALKAALTNLGESAHRQEAELMLAQIWLETGHGNSCFNWNVGNITLNPRTSNASFYRPPWFDPPEDASPHLLQLHELMLKKKAPEAFRAYASLDEGMNDYISKLQHSFPTLLAAMRTGDPVKTADAIKSSGYAPDAQPGTDRSLASLTREFEKGEIFSDLPLGVPVLSRGSFSGSGQRFSLSEKSDLPECELGQRGSAVTLIRILLRAGIETDVFDESVRDAVRVFQSAQRPRLPPTGKVDSATWTELLAGLTTRWRV